MRTDSAVVLILLALVQNSCASSHSLSASQRSVTASYGDQEWSPATPLDLEGMFESVEIRGEAAASLLRIYYCFNADRTYTGAALTSGSEHAEFTTLSGTWDLVDAQLQLDADESVAVSISGELLKLESAGGTAVLKRASIQ